MTVGITRNQSTTLRQNYELLEQCFFNYKPSTRYRSRLCHAVLPSIGQIWNHSTYRLREFSQFKNVQTNMRVRKDYPVKESYYFSTMACESHRFYHNYLTENYHKNIPLTLTLDLHNMHPVVCHIMALYGTVYTAIISTNKSMLMYRHSYIS
jgi:hypothetical protein